MFLESIRIQSLFWSVFPLLRLKTGIYTATVRIRLELLKIRIRKNSVFGFFLRGVTFLNESVQS